MAEQLAHLIITPAAMAKARTGGILARATARTGLDLAAAQVIRLGSQAAAYADALENDAGIPEADRTPLGDYVRGGTLDAGDGSLLLIYEGDNAVARLGAVVGDLPRDPLAGRTIRDTYGDLVTDATGAVVHFEPAVLTSATPAATHGALRALKPCCEAPQAIIPADDGGAIERSLVLIKPENFDFAGVRPGVIIDILSQSGLRLVAAKLHRMSLAQAEEFYGPVLPILKDKLRGRAAGLAAEAVAQGLDIRVPEALEQALGDALGDPFAEAQFERIIGFMSGCPPTETSGDARTAPGNAKILALIYEGPKAIETIRAILGATDPSKADVGTVRKEFGTDIMTNSAHASDAVANAIREMKIIRIEEPTTSATIERCPAP